ncbi:unnamed protein product [Paramecium octaurelia]|uniref:Protein kinase domain-containing protein n=1 Tax=Paramecium octaurelia TaxID=43137 RepID=A0A8S1RWQ1_PAROT|nr:unnamed protein product [Paramecium octaurelia]
MSDSDDSLKQQHQLPQNFGEIIDSDDENWMPPKKSYSQLEEFEPSKFNKNIVALDWDFNKVFVKQLQIEALQDPTWRAQVIKQFEIHPTLDHPNIVKVKEQNYEEKKIVLEFLNEANYFKKAILEQARPITNMIKLRSYIQDIAEGLNYLHNLNYVHMDIRIETLQCTRGPEDLIRTVKLGDFGNIQRKGDILDAFHYEFIKKRQPMMPPELAIGSQADPKMDIWCFGIVIHQMIMAYAPNLMPQNQNQPAKISFAKAHWSKYEVELFKLVKSMLQINANDRPSAQQILQIQWLQ